MIVTFLFSIIALQPQASAQPQEEDYAKWSKIAIEKMKEKYPRAKLNEYLYAGRTVISETEAEDRFLFYVKNHNDGLEVRAIVVFNPKTDQLITVKIKELS